MTISGRLTRPLDTSPAMVSGQVRVTYLEERAVSTSQIPVQQEQVSGTGNDPLPTQGRGIPRVKRTTSLGPPCLLVKPRNFAASDLMW